MTIANRLAAAAAVLLCAATPAASEGPRCPSADALAGDACLPIKGCFANGERFSGFAREPQRSGGDAAPRTAVVGLERGGVCSVDYAYLGSGAGVTFTGACGPEDAAGAFRGVAQIEDPATGLWFAEGRFVADGAAGPTFSATFVVGPPGAADAIDYPCPDGAGV